jgi:maltoporin
MIHKLDFHLYGSINEDIKSDVLFTLYHAGTVKVMFENFSVYVEQDYLAQQEQNMLDASTEGEQYTFYYENNNVAFSGKRIKNTMELSILDKRWTVESVVVNISIQSWYKLIRNMSLIKI